MNFLPSSTGFSLLQDRRTLLPIASLVLILIALPALAATTQENAEIDWFQLCMGLLGGLAMFLFGMEQMSGGLKAAAGDTLKDVLERLTKNRFMGALTGAFVTAILNSSSVTTVLVVGFISAGFMSLSQSVGVIMAKEDVKRLSDEFLSLQSERIGIKTETHLHLVRLELELPDKLRRIYTLAKRVAKDQVPAEVARRA